MLSEFSDTDGAPSVIQEDKNKRNQMEDFWENSCEISEKHYKKSVIGRKL